MALRDQPYFPLYIQDFLTDEKLIECDAASTGVYIRLLCIMHKSDQYGCVLLKQKDKQHGKRLLNFAYKLAKQMPYPIEIITDALKELFRERVIHCNGNLLFQKRMVRDNDISLKRAHAGRVGGEKTQFALAKSRAKNKANLKANTENENKGSSTNKKGRRKKASPPIEDVIQFFDSEGFPEDYARHVWKYYSDGNWTDSQGKPVINWKQKMRNNWFKDEKRTAPQESSDEALMRQYGAPK